MSTEVDEGCGGERESGAIKIKYLIGKREINST
jgi:hypothetical protein